MDCHEFEVCAAPLENAFVRQIVDLVRSFTDRTKVLLSARASISAALLKGSCLLYVFLDLRKIF